MRCNWYWYCRLVEVFGLPMGSSGTGLRMWTDLSRARVLSDWWALRRRTVFVSAGPVLSSYQHSHSDYEKQETTTPNTSSTFSPKSPAYASSQSPHSYSARASPSPTSATPPKRTAIPTSPYPHPCPAMSHSHSHSLPPVAGNATPLS